MMKTSLTARGADGRDGRVERLVGSDRVLAVLIELASVPAGANLDALATRVDSPKPTVHRALAALKRAGLARQDGRGHYVLGDEFLRLAFQHHESRPESVRVRPVLEQLAERFGETAHYAVLDGDDVVYRAKVDPLEGAVRLTSTIGGRNPARNTAVGKLLLSRTTSTLDELRARFGPGPFPARTANSITTIEGLFDELERTRARGYAVDDQENELGVNCIAVPLPFAVPGATAGAVSISALAYRTPLVDLEAALPEILQIVHGATTSERSA
jgi:DNA-binding IclR family transcriptional regulator